MPYRRNKSVAGRRPRRRYAMKGAKRLSKPMKKAVTQVAKKVLSRAAENKVIGELVEHQVQHNFPIGSADCKPLIPEISQGPFANQRVGDRITPKRLRVSGVVSLNPLQGWAAQGDIYGRLMILTQKDIKVSGQVNAGAVDTQHLLRPGLDGTPEIAFSGNTEELLYPINTEKFRVYYDKIFKFSIVKEDAVETMTRYSYRWSYTFKSLPASLTYDTANGDWANNFAPFVAVGFAYSDGTAPETIQTKFVTHTFTHLEFEDM